VDLLSVNLGTVRPLVAGGRTVRSGIAKAPVSGRVAVGVTGLAGDEQADLENHGGPDQAVYLYGADDYAWFSAALGREVAPPLFGENLTLASLGPAVRLGDRLRVGSALLEVSAPRVPCFKLAARMNEPDFALRFAEAGRPGAYTRVLEAGEVGAGDPVSHTPAPEHHPTIAEVLRLYVGSAEERGDLAAVRRAIGCPALGARLRADLGRRLERLASAR